jgi:hypothetical protein
MCTALTAKPTSTIHIRGPNECCIDLLNHCRCLSRASSNAGRLGREREVSTSIELRGEAAKITHGRGIPIVHSH